MKRFLTILAAALALTAALCVSASASSFDGAAADLAAIGMLKGDGAGGYALDIAPTRTQAAIMLVRLYGAEEEAKAAYASGELKCPFTDVNETGAPFAAWLADKGLASGTSAGAFGGSNPCTAKAYTIFLLRALGYKDGEDFTAASAQEFAMGLGLLDTSLFTGKFLRDDLAAMTYQALGMDMKGGGTYLLASLIESGAVDAEAARPTTEKIEAYRALQASGAAAAQGLDADIDANLSIGLVLKASDASVNMDEQAAVSVKGSIQAILDQDFQMAMDMTVSMKADGVTEEEKGQYWLKDGVMYVRSGEEAYQMPMNMGMDWEDFKTLLEQSAGQSYAAMLPFVDSIAVQTSGENTVCTLKLNDAFASIVDGLTASVLDVMSVESDIQADLDISMEGSTISYTLDKDGALKSARADLTLKVEMTASDSEESLTAVFTADMDMDMTIKATGKDVKITFPDFSGFESLYGGAGGVEAA